MKTILSVITIILLTNCQFWEGDILQNLMTDERIEILDVGKCGELYQSKKSEYDQMLEEVKDESIEIKTVFVTSVPLPQDFYGDDQENSECVSFEQSVYMEEVGLTMKYLRIDESEDYCNRRWKKLN